MAMETFLKSVIAKPEAFIGAPAGLTKKVQSALVECYADLFRIVPAEIQSPLSSLLVEGVDHEQIWGKAFPLC